MTVQACSAKQTLRLLVLANGATVKRARPAAKVPVAGAMPRARVGMLALVTAPVVMPDRVAIVLVGARIRVRRSRVWAMRRFARNVMRGKMPKWH